MQKPEVKSGRRWHNRLLVPLALALFAALLCAGPGAVTVPATIQLAGPLVCPAGSQLQQIEQPATVDGEAVVYVSLSCVGATVSSPASVNSVFAVLALIYCVIFGLVAVAAVAVFVRRSAGPGQRVAHPQSG